MAKIGTSQEIASAHVQHQVAEHHTTAPADRGVRKSHSWRHFVQMNRVVLVALEGGRRGMNAGVRPIGQSGKRGRGHR